MRYKIQSPDFLLLLALLHRDSMGEEQIIRNVVEEKAQCEHEAH